MGRQRSTALPRWSSAPRSIKTSRLTPAPSGTLKLDDGDAFTGAISGFDGNDQLDLADIDFGLIATMTYAANQDGTGGTLTVSDGTDTANITLLGQYTADGFQAADDQHLGTLITYHPPIA